MSTQSSVDIAQELGDPHVLLQKCRNFGDPALFSGLSRKDSMLSAFIASCFGGFPEVKATILQQQRRSTTAATTNVSSGIAKTNTKDNAKKSENGIHVLTNQKNSKLEPTETAHFRSSTGKVRLGPTTAAQPLSETDKTRILQEDLFLTDDEDESSKKPRKRSREDRADKTKSTTSGHNDEPPSKRNCSSTPRFSKDDLSRMLEAAKCALKLDVLQPVVARLSEKDMLVKMAKVKTTTQAIQPPRPWTAMRTVNPNPDPRSVVDYGDLEGAGDGGYRPYNPKSERLSPVGPVAHRPDVQPSSVMFPDSVPHLRPTRPRPLSPFIRLNSPSSLSLDFRICRRLDRARLHLQCPATPAMMRPEECRLEELCRPLVSFGNSVPENFLPRDSAVISLHDSLSSLPATAPLSKTSPWLAASVNAPASNELNNCTPAFSISSKCNTASDIADATLPPANSDPSSTVQQMDKKNRLSLTVSEYYRSRTKPTELSSLGGNASDSPLTTVSLKDSPQSGRSGFGIQCSMSSGALMPVAANKDYLQRPSGVALIIRRDSFGGGGESPAVEDLPPTSLMVNYMCPKDDEVRYLMKSSGGNPLLLHCPPNMVEAVRMVKELEKRQHEYLHDSYHTKESETSEEQLSEENEHLNSLFERGSMAYPRKVLNLLFLYLKHILHLEAAEDRDSLVNCLAHLMKAIPLWLSHVEKLFEDHGTRILLPLSSADMSSTRREEELCSQWRMIFTLLLLKACAIVCNALYKLTLKDVLEAKERMRTSLKNSSFTMSKWDNPSLLAPCNNNGNEMMNSNSTECNSVNSTPSDQGSSSHSNYPMMDYPILQNMAELREKSLCLTRAQEYWRRAQQLEQSNSGDVATQFHNEVTSHSGVALSQLNMSLLHLAHFLFHFLTLEKAQNTVCKPEC